MRQGAFGTTLSSLALLLATLPALADKKDSGQVIKLKPISPFTVADRASAFKRGQHVPIGEQPNKDVKAYPAFKSSKPLYGTLPLVSIRVPSHQASLLCFALDESGGTGTGYDLLYFDRDGDSDLAREKPIRPMQNPPEGAKLQGDYIEAQVVFNPVKIKCQTSQGKKGIVEALPRFMQHKGSGYTGFCFLPTKAFAGKLTLAEKSFDVYLGHADGLSPTFDNPRTSLFIASADGGETFQWWGGDRLNAFHKFGDRFYRFSAHPKGKSLTLTPYEGKLGKIELQACGREGIKDLSMHGSLSSADSAVCLGDESDRGPSDSVSSFEIPVGDYLPLVLYAKLDEVSIMLSNNYHSEGKRFTHDRKAQRTFKITEEKPFVLDFSNTPEIMFAAPAKDERIQVGAPLRVKAVLIDPKLQIMFRRVVLVGKDSPEPKVTIARAGGEKVADGVMPFG